MESGTQGRAPELRVQVALSGCAACMTQCPRAVGPFWVRCRVTTLRLLQQRGLGSWAAWVLVPALPVTDVWPRAYHLTSLGLNCPICKLG